MVLLYLICHSSSVLLNAYSIMESLSVSTTPAGCADPVFTPGSVFGFGLLVVLLTFSGTAPSGIAFFVTASPDAYFSTVCSAVFLAGSLGAAFDADRKSVV